MLVPASSFAYIDPNTGGYVFQMLLPIVSAIAAAFLFFKRQVFAFFSKIKNLLTGGGKDKHGGADKGGGGEDKSG